jgi:hypothetical protein
VATTVATLLTRIRQRLRESSAAFWTDAELIAILNGGTSDLWRAINDNFQDYFLTVDATNVSQAASTATLTGVPTNVSIVRGIEPRVLSNFPSLHYRPKTYNHPDFQAARAMSAQDPSLGGVVFYAIAGAGGPVAAPTIYVAPLLSSAVPLRLTFVPTLTPLDDSADENPIPGESDNALVAWGVAYALAKESDDNMPHAGWLGIYASEKTNLLTFLTPRQTDEDDVAEAIFENLW